MAEPHGGHFQDIQLQHGLPPGEGSVLSKPRGYLSDPESVVAISGPRFQDREAGGWSLCVQVKSHGPRGRWLSPSSPRCTRNLSSMRPVCAVWQRSLVWAAQITGMGKSGTERDRCWGKLVGQRHAAIACACVYPPPPSRGQKIR